VNEAKTSRHSNATLGLIYGLLGVLAFSFTVPMTRIAAPELGGVFTGVARAGIAALLAIGLLVILREPWPERRLWRGLVTVALGTVFGFGLLVSVAMESLPAAHGVVVVGLLPAATAVMAVLRAGERPSRAFWLACAAGVVAVLIFAAVQGAGRPQSEDLLLLAAVGLAALGYAEGGRLAREMGGWRVISWALVFSTPLLALVLGWMIAADGVPQGSTEAWWSFAYLGAVSMFLGFFPWYRGLALGGVARVGQVQLVQPVFSLVWAALLLGEHISIGTALAAIVVIATAALSRLTRAS
jgi:drug/metabolite transporter (DMT)-like permease